MKSVKFGSNYQKNKKGMSEDCAISHQNQGKTQITLFPNYLYLVAQGLLDLLQGHEQLSLFHSSLCFLAGWGYLIKEHNEGDEAPPKPGRQNFRTCRLYTLAWRWFSIQLSRDPADPGSRPAGYYQNNPGVAGFFHFLNRSCHINEIIQCERKVKITIRSVLFSSLLWKG